MMYALIFASSVYKYVVFRKNDGNNRVSIELRKEDYTLKKDFDLVLGDYIYMPNVQSYCEFEDGIILFTATAPEKNMDAEFVCKKVKDRVYECVYFDSVNESDFRISGKVLTIIAFILAAVDVILMVHWIAYSENREFLGELIECISIFDFGFGLSKLLKGAEGVGSKFMYGFSIFLMIISIMSFFFIFI